MIGDLACFEDQDHRIFDRVHAEHQKKGKVNFTCFDSEKWKARKCFFFFPLSKCDVNFMHQSE